MAGLLDNTKLDLLFKNLFLRARTSSDKAYYEENIPTALDIHASEIYLNPIPKNPPTVTNEVIKVYGSSNRLVLTKDRSVANNKAWVALGTWTNNWSSGSSDVSQILKNFVSPKYGKNYVVKVFKGNGTRIAELDDVNWVFDYKAGVLSFEKDPGQDGTSVGASIQIEVYQYIGQLGSNAMTSAELKALTDVDNSTPASNNNVLVYNSTTQKWQYKKAVIEPGLYQTVDVIGPTQRVFNLNAPYTVGNKSLIVYVNGLIQSSGIDYTETSSTIVTFNDDLLKDDRVLFVTNKISYV